MRETDLNNIMYFVTRTGMYIGKVTEDSICSFIRGYELGTNWKCKFTESISDLLATSYNCKKMSTGWPGQIREYSNKQNINWIIGFKQITLKYFYQTQNFSIDSEFKKALKSRIVSKIEQINLDWVRSGFHEWSNEWISLVDLKEEKFRTLWNEIELKILTSLNEEIYRIRTDKIQLTDRLLELKIEYQKITKTQQSTVVKNK